MADQIQQQAAPQAQPQEEPYVNVSRGDEVTSVPRSQLEIAQQQGYAPASQEDLQNYQNQSNYGDLGQQVGTFAEGAARTLSFGLSTKGEILSGLSTPQAIEGRQQANPIASTAGEIAGLVTPYGPESAAIEGLGHAASAAAGLEGAGALSKIGSAAVKGMIGNAVVQGGDEIHKMILQDPDQTAGTAMLDIGLSGLLGAGIGGGFGAVSPLWKAATGDKLGGFLGKLTDRVNGKPIELAPSIDEALDRSGMASEVTPLMRTALAQDPELTNQFQKLQESTTSTGLKAQGQLDSFHQAAANNILKSVGKDASTIPALSDLSDHEVGSSIQKNLANTIDEKIRPLTDAFENIKQQFSQVPVTEDIKNKLSEDLANISQKEGYGLSESSPQNKVINDAIRDITNVKTLDDIRKLQSIIGQNTYDVLNTKGLNQVGSQIKKAFRNVEDNLIEATAGAKSPELLGQIRDARNQYGQAMSMLDDLNDRLHVGNYGGGKSFTNALKEMNPENVLRRLSPKNNADTIGLLEKNFPEISSQLKSYHLDKVLAAASDKAKGEMPINTKTFFNALDKMSPEMRNYILPEGAANKISGTKALLESLPQRLNPSGTAKTLDSIWNKIPGSAMGLASLLTGHNPAIGFMLGQVGKWIGRDAPDAIRYAFLNFLGHAGPVEPAAFKTMVEYFHSAMKGEAMLNKGVGALFKAGSEVLPRSMLPSEQEKKKLSKQVGEYTADNNKIMNVGGNTAYYLPDHGTALSQTAMAATNYINSLKPSTDKLGILDPDKKPSMVEKSKYDRALQVAQQPLVVLDSIKKGNLTSQDVITLKTIHPGLYDRMSQKITNEITEQVSKGKSIPYNTRLGLGMFLMQPLDSTMTPQSIQMNQMGSMAKQQSQQPAPAGPKSTKALNKFSSQYQTPDQSRALQKSEKG